MLWELHNSTCQYYICTTENHFQVEEQNRAKLLLLQVSCQIFASFDFMLDLQWSDFSSSHLPGKISSDVRSQISNLTIHRIWRLGRFDTAKLLKSSHQYRNGKNHSTVYQLDMSFEEPYSLINFKSDKEKTAIPNSASLLCRASSTSVKTPLKTDTARNVLSGAMTLPEHVN